MSEYFDALKEAMTLVAQQPGSLIIGQAVRYPGTAMFNTLNHLPEECRLELPVALALAAARRRGIEEAADVADAYGDSILRDAIRALADKEPT